MPNTPTPTNVVRSILRAAACQPEPLDAVTQRRIWEWAKSRDDVAVEHLVERCDLDPGVAAEILVAGTESARCWLVTRPGIPSAELTAWVTAQRSTSIVIGALERVASERPTEPNEIENRNARLRAMLDAVTSPAVVVSACTDKRIPDEVCVAAIGRDDLDPDPLNKDQLLRVTNWFARRDELRRAALAGSTHPQILLAALETAQLGDISDADAARMWEILFRDGLGGAEVPAVLGVAAHAARLCCHFTDPRPYCAKVRRAVRRVAPPPNGQRIEVAVSAVHTVLEVARVSRCGTARELDRFVGPDPDESPVVGGTGYPRVATAVAANPNIAEATLIRVLHAVRGSGLDTALEARGELSERLAAAAVDTLDDPTWLLRCADPDAAFRSYLTRPDVANGERLAFEAIELFAGHTENRETIADYLRSLEGDFTLRWQQGSAARAVMVAAALDVVDNPAAAALIDELAPGWDGTVGELLGVAETAFAAA